MGEETVLWFCYKKRRKADRKLVVMLGRLFDVERVEGDWEGGEGRAGVWMYTVRRKEGKGEAGRVEI